MSAPTEKRPLRIFNMGGFYGSDLATPQRQLEDMLARGVKIDAVTWDDEAELTLSVYKERQLRGKPGYASTALVRLNKMVELCKKHNIKILLNSGGLEPDTMAKDIKGLLEKKGLDKDMKVAHIEGDNLQPRIDELNAAGEALTHMDEGIPLSDATKAPDTQVATANAYLGCWGMVEALNQDADIIISGRTTDASTIMAAAAHHHGWGRHDYDPLAGALTAAHIAECGTQATGGNYCRAFAEGVDFNNMGYPIIEIYENGDFVLTKPENTGGKVSVNTATAQSTYEIQKRDYLNPDVTLDLTSPRMIQEGENRVRVTGCKGSAPTPKHKVCVNLSIPQERPELKDKFTAVVEVGLAGLDRKEKAALFYKQLLSQVKRDDYNAISAEVVGDPDSTYQTLRITAKGKTEKAVGAFNRASNGQLLATYPGAFFIKTVSFTGDQTYVHWPTLVDGKHIKETVHIDGRQTEVLPTSQLEGYEETPFVPANENVPQYKAEPGEEMVDIPLGRVFCTRSGDKGGNANIGIWVPQGLEADQEQQLYAYLHEHLTPEELRELNPEIFQEFEIEKHALPNLNALNFRVLGVLGQGVAASSRMDPQAKAMGEIVGAATIKVPKRLLTSEMARHIDEKPEPLKPGTLDLEAA